MKLITWIAAFFISLAFNTSIGASDQTQFEMNQDEEGRLGSTRCVNGPMAFRKVMFAREARNSRSDEMIGSTLDAIRADPLPRLKERWQSLPVTLPFVRYGTLIASNYN